MVAAGGLVNIVHAGMVVATHVQRLRTDQAGRKPRAVTQRRARDATKGLAVARLADAPGWSASPGHRMAAAAGGPAPPSTSRS